MSRFHISELIVKGPKVRDSRLAFTDGVNIIHGPSNTGKSYVIGCIDFILGGDIPFTMGSTGYDTVGMRLLSDDGATAYMERKIVEGKKGETGEGTWPQKHQPGAGAQEGDCVFWRREEA